VKGWSTAKRTKVVCTIGPASESPRVLGALIREGMDVARLNFSHGTREEHGRTAHLVRRLAEREGRPVAVLGDLAGPRIRVGRVAEGTVLVPGSKVTVTPRDVEGDADTIPVSYAGLARDVTRGDALLLADGAIELRVASHLENSRQVTVVSYQFSEPQTYPKNPFNTVRALRVTHLLGLPFCSMFTWKRPLNVPSRLHLPCPSCLEMTRSMASRIRSSR